MTAPGSWPTSLRAELIASAWEIFSALLFVSAVVPAAIARWPALLFAASLVVSAALQGVFRRWGRRGFVLAGALRLVSWVVAISPMLPDRPRATSAAVAFGLMAWGIRAATYRRIIAPPGPDVPPSELARSLRAELAESAMVAGIVGGHALLLFSVAFLRTQSKDIFRGWWEMVPFLALLGTGAFTLALRPTTTDIEVALRAGPQAPREVLDRGIAQAERLPSVLAYINFGSWLFCSTIGVFYFQTGPSSWTAGDAVTQVAFAGLFSWGVSFYQRAWHRETAARAVRHLRAWTGGVEVREPTPLRTRMLRDFGLPLVFTAALSLLASIGLYRALAEALSFEEDVNAVIALVASFGILVLAVGAVIARAARDLSEPMAELADAADRVANGGLEAAVPRLSGPREVVGLGESVERMREALARTIGELEAERATLEIRVEKRTAELQRALAELKATQAALVQGERLASIGELVAGIAHELYNPLSAVAGSAEPLERVVEEVRRVLDVYRAAETELPFVRRRELEELRKKLDLDASLDDLVGISAVVRRATDRSVRIVQNLKNFSRAPTEAAPTDLHAGMEETLMLLAPRLRQACIQVSKAYGRLPLVVCRPGELNQVFMNLLVNAIQAIEGASARPAEPDIRIETRTDGASAVVTIDDCGPGIPPEARQRIFDPFFTTKPKGQGTGLGLSIASDIARRHGGSLTLEPAPGRGARFVLRVPLEGPGEGRASSP